MKHLLITSFFAAAVLISSSVAYGQSNLTLGAEEKQALQAAESWLSLIEKSKFSKSWDACSPFFQENFPKETWTRTMDSTFSILGKVEKRELFQSNFYTELPNAPEGEYVIIQFKTKFKKRDEQVTETIIPKKVGDEWKVVSYFVF